MSFFVPTKFLWRFGGSQVHLCGSFTRWVETVPMTPVDAQQGTFSVVVHLPPGYHQYKFIVDGEWRHDETQPFMPDPLGNVNNWLFVRKPEQSAATPQQQPAQQGIATSFNAASPAQHPAQLTPSSATHIHTPPSGIANSTPEALSPAAMEIAGAPPLSSSSQQQQQHQQVNDGVIPPIAAEIEEPQYTRRKIKEFLSHHTAYELIPESGKVVLLDVDLPLRQAFHALHEQGIASGPLYDSTTGAVCGTVSASDFIATLQRLRNIVSTSSNPMSEAEMDQHTIRGLRDELQAEGRPIKDLVYVTPSEILAGVVKTLYENHCSMAPILYPGPESDEDDVGPDVLHAATLSGVLGCLMRHFRSSLASLPLLAQPLHTLCMGTWSIDSVTVLRAGNSNKGEENLIPSANGTTKRKVARINTVTPNTSLTEALGLLLEAGISCLPVVDENGALIDVYARADITALAKANAYSRLQFEDVTVGQALSLLAQPAPPGMHMLSQGNHMQQWGGASPAGSVASMQEALVAGQKQRVHMCSAGDSLRSVVERLSVPGVRRLIIVNGETRRVEGIVSLSDVASFILL